MNKSEDISELVKAVLEVMKEVKGVEKNASVGSGSYGYKGVSDQDVKQIIGGSMQKHNLCLLPVNVNPNKEVNRWQDAHGKEKQSVFTEVNTTYLLTHSSGQYVELAGYGQGVDTQDKGAGKATTYALKYTLLYAFLIPTGTIDDADTTHSNDYPINGKPQWWEQAVNYLKHMDGTIEAIKAKYPLTPELEKELLKIKK